MISKWITVLILSVLMGGFCLPVYSDVSQEVKDYIEERLCGLQIEKVLIPVEDNDPVEAIKLSLPGTNPDALACFIIKTNSDPTNPESIPENRWAVWGKNIPLKMNADGSLYGVNNFADGTYGDIIALGSVPYRVFERADINLPASAVTLLQSAKRGSDDDNGGAFITLAPYDPNTPDNGYIKFTTHGSPEASSSISNSFIFECRDSEGNTQTTAQIKGVNQIGVYQTSLSVKVNIGGEIVDRDIYVSDVNSAGEYFRQLMVIN